MYVSSCLWCLVDKTLGCRVTINQVDTRKYFKTVECHLSPSGMHRMKDRNDRNVLVALIRITPFRIIRWIILQKWLVKRTMLLNCSCHGCLLENFVAQLKICKGSACQLSLRKSNYTLARIGTQDLPDWNTVLWSLGYSNWQPVRHPWHCSLLHNLFKNITNVNVATILLLSIQ